MWQSANMKLVTLARAVTGHIMTVFLNHRRINKPVFKLRQDFILRSLESF